jgi:hypothetical protein
MEFLSDVAATDRAFPSLEIHQSVDQVDGVSHPVGSSGRIGHPNPQANLFAVS